MRSRILIVVGIIGILDTVILSMFVNATNFGILFPGIAGFALVIIGINREYNIYKLPESMQWIKLVLKYLIIVWIISFVIIEGILVFSSRSEKNNKADYIVILGAGLRGRELSLTLLERLDKGLEYLNKNSEALVIVSGGQGFGEEISEAEAMKEYLIANGIKGERIVKEDRSTSTMENFKNTKEILERIHNGTIKILIVTNDFHMFRSKLLARRNGFIPYGIPSRTPWSILPNCYIREYFAVLKSLVFDR